jgi:hypothetical protein
MKRTPSADEAVAIAAAVERFKVETALAKAAAREAIGPWQRAALVEGVGAKGTVRTHLEGGAQWLS